VYGWIWRHIPFKQWQLKALVSAVLAGAVAALLWYQVFPAVEPLLPFDDVQVEAGTEDSNSVIPGSSTGTDADAPDEIPYSVTSNHPGPSPSR